MEAGGATQRSMEAAHWYQVPWTAKEFPRAMQEGGGDADPWDEEEESWEVAGAMTEQ